MSDTNGHSPLRTMDDDRDGQRDRSRSPIRRKRDGGRDRDRGDRHSDRGDRNGDRGRRDNLRRVYISNIPYEMRWQDIKDLFREKVGEVTYVEMYEVDGQSTGTGVIEFRTKELADKAIEEMNRFEIKTRKIIVREETLKDRMRHERQMQRTKMGGSGSGMGGNLGGGSSGLMGSMPNMGMGGDMGYMGGGASGGMSGMSSMSQMSSNSSSSNMGGVSPQLLNQLGIDGPVTNQVFVANLDYKVSERKLRDIFKMAGNIVDAELKIDREGKSRGMGIIRFDHPVEAVQAISMFNGQILYDRAMSVRMDKLGDSGSQSIPDKLPSGLKSIGMGLGAGGAPLQNVKQFDVMGSGSSNMGSVGGGGMGMGSSNMGSMGGSSMGGTGMGGGGMSTGMGGMMGNQMSGNTMGLAGMQSTSMGSGMGMGGGMSDMGMGGSMGTSSSMGLGSMNTMGGGMGMMGSSNLSSSMSSGLDNSLGSMSGFQGSGLSMGTSMSSQSRGERSYYKPMATPRKGQEGCSIMVKNLPYSATWKDLRENFNRFGEVRYAEIQMEDGKSKGVGVIRFSDPDEALKAIDSMHGTDFKGRRLVVRLYS